MEAPAGTRDALTFELLWSNDRAPESFHLIGPFHVRNVLVADSPYQAFTFPAVTARYLKFRLISSYHGGYTLLTRFRLLGRLEAQEPEEDSQESSVRDVLGCADLECRVGYYDRSCGAGEEAAINKDVGQLPLWLSATIATRTPHRIDTS